MAAKGKGLGPREELLFAGAMLILAVAAWYLALFQPVQVKISRIEAEMAQNRDSLNAVQQYTAQEKRFMVLAEQAKQEISDWEARLPSRDSIVVLARTLMDYAAEHQVRLVSIKPSLYELYALEKAGAPVTGRFVMQLPLKFQLQGRYLDLGKMLEDVDRLPFRMTVSDLQLASTGSQSAEVDIGLDVYLYVRL